MPRAYRNQAFLHSLKTSTHRDGTLHVWRFIYKWFREAGRSYYFLFKKNTDVTNVQFAELLALVKRYAFNPRDKRDPCTLHFYKMSEFAQTLGQLAAAFPDDDWADQVSQRYATFFKSVAVLDLFRGSCGVYLPPGVDVHLDGVCADSGYIHSCGWSVFTMTIDEAAVREMTETLKGHMQRRHRAGTVPFRLYAREDFKESDRKYADEMRHGLADVQLRLEKYYVGRKSLAEYVASLKRNRTLKRRLTICRGDEGPSREKQTMWLLVDHAIDSTAPGTPIGKPYFICYDQVFKNESMLQVFDENKPAWIDHVTLPHSLACAMLNLAVPDRPTRKLSVCDPFVGSGTVLLEATKLDRPTLRASDHDDAMPDVITDNLAVFRADGDTLKQLRDAVVQIGRQGLEQIERAGLAQSAKTTVWERTYRIAESYRERRATWRKVKHAMPTLQDRMPFYVWLRVIIRHAAALKWGSERLGHAWEVEMEKLGVQLDDLIKIKEKMKGVSSKDRHRVCRSDYSFGVSPSFGFTALKQNPRIIRVGKAEKLLKTSPNNIKYDAIVTDPPYGFNTPGTDDTDKMLADLYRDVLPLLVDRLRDNGSLVICLPERAYTKRQSPFFVTARFVTHQVLAAAVTCNKEVVRPSHIMPAGFRPPYYWESERALRRAVLVFRFRDRGRASSR